MSNNSASPASYEEVKQRLDQIFEDVKSEDVSLDDALALYEEAVKLGLRASELIEDDTLGAGASQAASDESGDAPNLA